VTLYIVHIERVTLLPNFLILDTVWSTPAHDNGLQKQLTATLDWCYEDMSVGDQVNIRNCDIQDVYMLRLESINRRCHHP
jgi:hypothetical protein